MERAAGLGTMAPAMEEARNYNDWVYGALRPHLGRRVLEVGPGYGGAASRILADKREYRAIDVDAGVIGRLRLLLGLGEDRLVAGELSSWTGRFRAAGVDTVLMINVLEHVEDDLGLLKLAARCAPGGTLVLMVPALRALYGSLDREAGHFRRYGRSDLRALLVQAGCNVRRVSFLNAVGVPFWFVSARILRLKLDAENTGSSVRFFDRWVVPAARRLDPCLNWLCGQSLVAVAELPPA